MSSECDWRRTVNFDETDVALNKVESGGDDRRGLSCLCTYCTSDEDDGETRIGCG